jgi:hypothetical protein
MENNTIEAAKNPGLANKLAQEALAVDVEQDAPKEAVIKLPSDTVVDLPGGYISPTGEVIKTAEVRELNGRDEEIIVKSATVGRMLNTVLSRGVVSIGGEKATEGMLDALFTGDRDALLLGIYRVTFGNPAELRAYCSGCDDYKEVSVDLLTDIKTKILADPVENREFTVQGKDNTYTVVLPTGITQKELNNSSDKTLSELGSILLQNTVVAIDGKIVYNKDQILNLGILDRRKIGDEISQRSPGPKFEDIEVTCPDCNTEVVVPISLGGLFQF